MSILYAKKCIEISNKEGVDTFYPAYECEASAGGLVIEGKKKEAPDYIEKFKKAPADSEEGELDLIKSELSEPESDIEKSDEVW